MLVSLTVNGVKRSADVEPRTLLAELLRNHLALTGTHVGCDTSQCGACVVHVNVNDLSVGRNVDEVLRVLDALQTDELCPCNWQRGEPTLEAA